VNAQIQEESKTKLL